MARQLRIQYPGAYYHVTSRGNGGQDIYKDYRDYDRFLNILSESIDIFNVSLLAYACMTNHFHLFLTTPEANLAEFMRHFNITYTSAFNRRHNRAGHLYQGRYKSLLVDADHYLKEVSRYIHLNPVRIKKHARKSVEEKIRLLDQHRYSSFGGYVRLKKRVDFINYQKILDCFGGDTSQGRKRYRRFVYNGLTGDLEGVSDLVNKMGIIGDSDFVEHIRQTYLEKDAGQSHREQPQLKVARTYWMPEDLIKNVSQILGKEEDEICRRGKNAKDRAMLMELLYRFCDITQAEVGRLVGGIDYSAVSVARKRLRLSMESDAALKQQFEEIADKLSRLKI
ncbi:MAG: transposase [Desulfobacterales bacterium]|nr:transposase [Desulfobacterales bacterium]